MHRYQASFQLLLVEKKSGAAAPQQQQQQQLQLQLRYNNLYSLQLAATTTKLIMSISSCSLWSTRKLVLQVFYSKLIPPPPLPPKTTTTTTTTTTTSWWSACQVQHVMFSFLSSTPLHDQPGCCCCCYISCCFATHTWILTRLENLISQYCKLLLLTLHSAPDHIIINSDHSLTAWSIIIIITTTTTITSSSSCSTAWARHSQLQELCHGYTHMPLELGSYVATQRKLLVLLSHWSKCKLRCTCCCCCCNRTDMLQQRRSTWVAVFSAPTKQHQNGR